MKTPPDFSGGFLLKYTLQEGNRFHIREYGKPYKIHRAINILLFPYTHAPRKRGAFFMPILKKYCTKSIDFWYNICYNKSTIKKRRRPTAKEV